VLGAKSNDAETIDKILRTILFWVTGSGKIFNKQESLQEARSHSTIYGHQEHTERTVRVWAIRLLLRGGMALCFWSSVTAAAESALISETQPQTFALL
jgi:hypothetical protein